MQVTVQPIWPWWFLVPVMTGMVVLSVWTYQKYPRRRKVLLPIRLAAILLALFAAVRPTLVFSKKLKQSSMIVIMQDVSKSMNLRDMWDNQSRWEVVGKVLQDAKADLEELGQEVQIRYYSFDRLLREGLQHDPPEGDQTAYGAALTEILQQTQGERVARVLVLSDGTNTAGVSPLTAARQWSIQHVPIDTFGIGKETASEQVRDIVARTVTAPTTVFKKNKLTVRGEFNVAGYNQPINVRMLINGVEKATQTIKPAADADRMIVDVTAIADVAGDVKVTLAADPQSGELRTENNSISTYLTVLDGGIAVLHLEGKYRFWEPKYLRWALDESPDIELSQVFLLRNDGKDNPLPPNFFSQEKFDVVIIGDLASSRLTADQQRAIEALVRRGGGLLMIGGYESFGPGNWDKSPIGQMLPVNMAASDPVLKEPMTIKPTDAGNRHYVMRLALDPIENDRIWQSLRPLDGGSGWPRGLKPNAVLLAQSTTQQPLMAAADAGNGRALAFGGDTTWRWRRNKEGIAAHAKFWRQLILWLAHKEDAADNPLRLKLAKRRLAIGQALPIEAVVLDPKGEPLDAQVQGVVTGPDGKDVAITFRRQGDNYLANVLKTDLPGDYTVKVLASDGGKPLGSREIKFLVYEEDTELQLLAADWETQRAVAQLTGGDFKPVEEFPRVVRNLKKRDLNQEITQPTYDALWDRWELFALFMALICLEWTLRKKMGMP